MRLTLITPETTVPQEHQLVERLVKGGLQTLHVRKQFSAPALQGYLQALSPEARRCCVLHTHHELAKGMTIKGIHYKEADRPQVVKAPPGLTVSTSFHQLEQLGTCFGRVDYVFLSPVFESISKAEYPSAFPDRQELSDWLISSRYPVFALGGVTRDRLEEVHALGFAGAALLGAVWEAADPVEEFQAASRACDLIREHTGLT